MRIENNAHEIQTLERMNRANRNNSRLEANEANEANLISRSFTYQPLQPFYARLRNKCLHR